MTQRPITWTDEEIGRACDLMNLHPCWRPGLREALAKLGAVHPAEAREQARAAWDASQIFMWGRSLAFKDFEVCGRKANEERDRQLPSLLPKSPPPLVLSTGTWERYTGGWRTSDGRQTVFGNPAPIFPDIQNASDARNLADWLQQYGSAEERK